MAEKWKERKSEFEKLKSATKDYTSKEIQGHLDDFKKIYKECRNLEEKLAADALAARERGFKGGTFKEFKADAAFYATYKQLDRLADDLAKVQKKAWGGANLARAAVGDFKILLEDIERDTKKYVTELKEAESKLADEQTKAKKGKGTISPSTVKLVDTIDKEQKKSKSEFASLRSEIDKMIKDLNEAAGLYRKELDQRMESYLDKFNKNLERIVGAVPDAKEDKDDKDKPKLHKDLQPGTLGVRVKKALTMRKAIDKFLTAALKKGERNIEFSRSDMKAAKHELAALEKAQEDLKKTRKTLTEEIKAAEKKNEIEKLFESVDKACESALDEIAKAETKLETMAKRA